MCGILGIHSQKMEKYLIVRMTESLRHRGPDDEGYLAVNTVERSVFPLSGKDSKVSLPDINGFSEKADLFLSHRRLSIIDLTPSGHQPMSNMDGTIWVTYNGELYNYLEIREELIAKGYLFHTRNDTEVLLAGYLEWGEECLDHFDGMWAFVIYDKRKNILFGSRDRFGVKPLYYLHRNELFAFASETKAFLEIPEFGRAIRELSVFEYLVLAKDQWADGSTFFEEIQELPPSHAFQYDLKDKELKVYRYYSLPFRDGKGWERFSSEKADSHVSVVSELVYESVRRRLISDVPVGSCLSGGIDSSSIVCVIAHLKKNERIKEVGDHPRTFTVCYQNEKIDESAWAKLVAEQTNAKWYPTYPLKEELWEDLEDLVRVQDFPFGSTSIYAQYRVMKLAKEKGVTVLLDGQGGDELFTGYAPYYTTFFREMIKQRAWDDLKREWRSLGNASIGKKALVTSISKTVIKRSFPLFLSKSLYRRNHHLLGYMSTTFCEGVASQAIENHFRTRTPESDLRTMMASLMCNHSLPTLLRYEDRNSMRFQIESRTPFADDRRLIEAVFSIPSVYKIHNGYSKWLLREAMKGILPDVIYRRKDKIGFATPEYQWLTPRKEELKKRVCGQLPAYIDTDRVYKEWDSMFEKQPKQGVMPIWRFINLAIWLEMVNTKTG